MNLDEAGMVVWEEMWKRDGGLKPGQAFDGRASSIYLLFHNCMGCGCALKQAAKALGLRRAELRSVLRLDPIASIQMPACMRSLR